MSAPLVHDLASSPADQPDDAGGYQGPCVPTQPVPVRLHTPEEECGLGPACWLWDYLRRSGALRGHAHSRFTALLDVDWTATTSPTRAGGSGFLLPLSGGADSSAVAAIVGVMCNLVYAAIEEGNERVLADARRVMGHAPDSDFR